MIIENICTQVKQVAQSVGRYLFEEQQKLKTDDVELKGFRNYVTYVDKEAEKKLVKALQDIMPDAGFLTEEETVVTEEKELMWIIDPLDGTTNFIHGGTPYAVSIALTRDNKPILGVIFDPVANQMFSATGVDKVYLNDKPIKVSNHSALDNAYIGFGIPYHLDSKGEKILLNATTHFRRCSFRIKGSAALELCYVACGMYDAYFHSGLSPWDVAAGTFILQCAGGVCTDFSNSDNYIFGREIVAANKNLHREIMDNIIIQE